MEIVAELDATDIGQLHERLIAQRGGGAAEESPPPSPSPSPPTPPALPSSPAVSRETMSDAARAIHDQIAAEKAKPKKDYKKLKQLRGVRDVGSDT